jgi:hypothetical protein
MDNPVVPGAPAPPAPEKIVLDRLPLPPTITSNDPGACTKQVNPKGSGCITAVGQSGGYIDPADVITLATFAGAPAAPDPASVYTDQQLIIVKTDGSTFANGDAWKCLTCGTPAANQQGRNKDASYPQPFNDHKRILLGPNVLDCSPHLLTDDSCTPDQVHIYPIRWNTHADGSGNGGNIRELRINPDNVHLGFNHVKLTGATYDQFGYYGRLQFDPAPTTGTPTVARYDIVDVTALFDPAPEQQGVHADPAHPGTLAINPLSREVGEFRGWTKDGREAVYIGYPSESDNIDVFAVDLFSGKVRRLTADPEYVDPLDMAPDGNGGVYLDTRGSGRQLFVAGMRGIPPLNDLITTGPVSSVRNAGDRRFFQPFLIDNYGDRGTYDGQQLNPTDTGPGGLGDPNWNASADPRWSPDGTTITYAQIAAPGATSTEPGGRRSRLIIAHLTDRTPYAYTPPATLPDQIGWGTPYKAGDPEPTRPLAPAGTWTLPGQKSGSAKVIITHDDAKAIMSKVEVTYANYSDDDTHIINGTESVETLPDSTQTTTKTLWHSNLTLSGTHTGTKVTSEPGGFTLTIDLLTNHFDAVGTLTTTIDGTAYKQPANGQ